MLVVFTGAAGEGVMFAPDQSGWARFTPAGVLAARPLVFLGFAMTTDASAIVIRDVQLSTTRQSIDSKDLRDVPLGRVTAAVNRPRDLLGLATWLPIMNSHRTSFPEELFVRDEQDREWPWWMYGPDRPKGPRAPRLKLHVPDGHKKPDSFYEQVADRFAYLAGMSARPARDLAEANDVPVTTVHGWVKEARRRKLLASGERARRGEPS